MYWNCSRLPAALVTLALFAWAPTGQADDIVVDGIRYTDVYVRVTDSMYFIQTPDDGKIITALPTSVEPSSVQLSADEAYREALLARWKAHNPSHQARVKEEAQIARVEARAASSEFETAPVIATLALQGATAPSNPDITTLRSNGYVPYIKLKDVPLATALDGILRPMGLDYKIYGDIVYVSSPDLLRRESFEAVETRYYRINGNDTMPKIVLGGIPQIAGGGGGTSGLRSGFGGGGGNQLGGGQLGGGGGRGGFAGGQGGGQGGGGGFGGGQGGGGGDVTSIGNISQLFSTIDDRQVGEAPATIGSGYYFQD